MATAVQLAVAKWEWRQPSPGRGAYGGQIAGMDRTDAALDLDVGLVERCLTGQDAAWEELVKLHTRRVFAICYRFTGSDSEAQDLSQEVFLRVFKNLKSFRSGEGSFVVWLARLTRNLRIDHYRRAEVRRAPG